LPGLRDIGPLTIPLEVGGTTIKFAGLSVGDIFDLSERFTVFHALVEGGTAGLVKALRDTPALLKQFPEAVCAAVAVSTGERGDKGAEAAAAALPMSVQLEMVDAMLRATFREGVGPFVQMIDRLTTITKPTTTTETSTAKPSKARSAKPSPAPSLAALQVELPPERLGRIRLAS
jgi:hypothetical protein